MYDTAGALHLKTNAAVKHLAYAGSHIDEVQSLCREGDHIAVQFRTNESSRIEVFHFIDLAVNHSAVCTGLCRQGQCSELNDTDTVIDIQRAWMLESLVCHRDIVIILHLLSVNDKGKLITAVFETLAEGGSAKGLLIP